MAVKKIFTLKFVSIITKFLLHNWQNWIFTIQFFWQCPDVNITSLPPLITFNVIRNCVQVVRKPWFHGSESLKWRGREIVTSFNDNKNWRHHLWTAFCLHFFCVIFSRHRAYKFNERFCKQTESISSPLQLIFSAYCSELISSAEHKYFQSQVVQVSKSSNRSEFRFTLNKHEYR